MNAPAPAVLDTTALQAESRSLLVPADFKITTAEQYQHAGSQLTALKAMLQKIGLTFDPHIKRAHDAHKALVAEKRTHENPLLTAETTLKKAMLSFLAEQDRIRQEQEAKARIAAEKERQKLEERAAKQEAAGKVGKAEALREQAALVPTAVVETQVPKVDGTSVRETWKFEVTDETLIPREYLALDEAKIGAVVRAMKSATNIPGIRAFPDKGISSRSS